MCMFQVSGSMKCSWVQQVSCKLDGPPLIVNFHRKLVLVSAILWGSGASAIMLNNLYQHLMYEVPLVYLRVAVISLKWQPNPFVQGILEYLKVCVTHRKRPMDLTLPRLCVAVKVYHSAYFSAFPVNHLDILFTQILMGISFDRVLPSPA